MNPTRHFEKRMRQRGYKSTDLDLILDSGTAVRDGIFMSREAIEAAILERKHEIASLERLHRSLVVVKNDVAVTIQRARRWKEQRLLGCQ